MGKEEASDERKMGKSYTVTNPIIKRNRNRKHLPAMLRSHYLPQTGTYCHQKKEGKRSKYRLIKYRLITLPTSSLEVCGRCLSQGLPLGPTPSLLLHPRRVWRLVGCPISAAASAAVLVPCKNTGLTAQALFPTISTSLTERKR